MLGIAVAHRKVGIKGAYNAAMAERLYQIRKFGEVEGPYGHGIELEYSFLHIIPFKFVTFPATQLQVTHLDCSLLCCSGIHGFTSRLQ
jgi:hypothetical protein